MSDQIKNTCKLTWKKNSQLKNLYDRKMDKGPKQNIPTGMAKI